jgi:MtN3 and saliva related transmembrane protein
MSSVKEDFISEIVAYIGGCLFVICLLPQLYLIIRYKNVENISKTTYFILLLGDLLYVSYGIIKAELEIIIPNILCSLLTFLIILLCFLYSKKKSENKLEIDV